MAKQLTNIRLPVLQSVAAHSSLPKNIRMAAATKNHSSMAAVVEETDEKPAESELPCFIKNPTAVCSLGATSVCRYKHTYKNNGLTYQDCKVQQPRIFCSPVYRAIGSDILVASTQSHFTSITEHNCI